LIKATVEQSKVASNQTGEAAREAALIAQASSLESMCIQWHL
jgi:hypothetical protein